MNLKDEIEDIWKNLPEHMERQASSSYVEVAETVRAEVHCVAVCFRDDGRILIALRPQSKRRLPNTWEFGCGQLQLHETFEDCLSRSYREDFGAELNVGKSLIPIRTYTIVDEDEKRRIPGVIFLAYISNHDAIRAKRHTRIDWLDPKDVDSWDDSRCVPNFKETIQMAYEAYSRNHAS